MANHPLMLPGVSNRTAVYPGYAPGRLGEDIGAQFQRQYLKLDTSGPLARVSFPAFPFVFGVVGAVGGAYLAKSPGVGALVGGLAGFLLAAGSRHVEEALQA